MNPVGLKEEYPSSDPIDWCYRITKKVLCQITIKSYHFQQQLKWIVHVTRKEKNNIMKMLIFLKQKVRKETPVSI